MKAILVLGAGKIGSVIAAMLAHCGDYRVRLADRDAAAVAGAAKGLERIQLDVADAAALARALAGCFAVVNALPYSAGAAVATAARDARCHYFDLTEDRASTQAIRELAVGDTIFAPQCGLAPGFVSIVAWDLASRFERLDSVRLRVGALPRYPANALKYNLTWSTDGLINEYCNPCQAIVGGELTELQPLEQLEHFSLDGVEYEAFNTSGGLGTLCESFAGRVRELNYRTVRYPGHRDIVRMLLRDLRLCERRDLARELFEYALPATRQDVVLVFVTVTGEQNGRLLQESYANRFYGRELLGEARSGIQLTTASGLCAVLDLVATGALPARGFLRQEDVPLAAFLDNRFGRYYLAAPAAQEDSDGQDVQQRG